MKAMFAKVLGLTLVLALVLSGCNLIEVDAKMQADKDIAKIDKDFAVAAATYDGGEVTVAEVIDDYNAAYNELASMYSYFGLQMDHESEHVLVENALSGRVRSEIAAAHFDAEHSLDDEKLAGIETLAQEEYEANLASVINAVNGDNENQRSENARVLLHANGMDYDAIYESRVLAAKVEAMEELLRGEITELTEEELQSAYADQVERQQETYTDGSSLEQVMTSENAVLCWVPDGYRTVKHILVVPSDEVKNAYTEAVSVLNIAQNILDELEVELEAEDGERTAEEIQADIDAAEAEVQKQQTAVETAAQACLDDVKDTTDAIYERLEAGESFEDLMEEYGEDPGMQNEPTKTRGYYVSNESVSWEPNFRDAAMALNQVGDYTAEPVVSGSGVHIIMYASDVLGGEVGLDEVRDAIYDSALEARQEEYATETIDAWVEESNPTYDVDAFETALAGE